MVRQELIEDNDPPGFDFPIDLPGPSVNEPQEGLVQVGDWGFYATPDKIDPRDCEFYPDSPWCGGNPLNWKSFVEMEVEVVADSCNVGLQFNGTFGWIRQPQRQIVWRRPECRLPDPPPFDSPSEPGFTTPQGFNRDIDPNTRVFAFVGQDSINTLIFENHFSCWEQYGRSFASYQGTFGTIKRIQCPGRIARVGGQNVVSRVSYEVETIATYNNSYKAGETAFASCYISKPTSETIQGRSGWIDYNDGALIYYYDFDDEGNVYSYTLKSTGNTTITSASIIPTRRIELCFVAGVPATVANGKWGDIALFYNRRTTAAPNWQYTNKCQFVIREDCSRVPIFPKPPPPPTPPDPPCCMDCCPSSPTDLEEIKRMLRRLLKLIGNPQSPAKDVLNSQYKIMKFLGTEDLPGKLPKRLIYPNGSGQEEVKTLLDFLGFQIKQVDRAIGHLPVKVKVADTNPAKAGNQSVEVEIHSLADMMRETLTYLIDTEGDVDALENMGVRTLYECGFIHQLCVQIAAMCDCMVDFMDFKQEYKKTRVPFAFDPHAGTQKKKGFGQTSGTGKDAKDEKEVEANLPRLLTNKEVDIRILVNDQTKTLSDILNDIKRDTAIAAAGAGEKATPERLEQLVAAAQLAIRMGSAINRQDVRQSMTAGKLVTRKKPKKGGRK